MSNDTRSGEGACTHTQLLARDFANQPRPLDGPCLFCEREGLLTELRELRGALEAARSDSHAWEATANDWKDRHAAVTAALSDADNLIEEWIGILLENGMRDTAIDGEAMRATIAALRARDV